MEIRKISGLILGAVIGACGQKPVDIHQLNVAPVGSIQGVVIDEETNKRVEGAVVETLANGKWRTVTTDSTGAFIFTDLPVGTAYTLYVGPGSSIIPAAKSVYEVMLPNNSTEFPTENALATVNARLFHLDSAIQGTIEAFSLGCTPFTGSASVDFRFLSSQQDPQFVGIEYITSTTTTAGAFTLSALPSGINGSILGSVPYIYLSYFDESQKQYKTWSVPGYLYGNILFPNKIGYTGDWCF